MDWFIKTMNWLSRTLGRFLYAIPLLLFGVLHFVSGTQMATMVPIPGGIIWIYITGAALIAAAISIVIGYKDKLAAFLLGLMVLLFAFLVQMAGMVDAQAALDAAVEGSEAAGQAQMQVGMYTSAMLKDIAIAGAAWMYAGSVGAKDQGKVPLAPAA